MAQIPPTGPKSPRPQPLDAQSTPANGNEQKLANSDKLTAAETGSWVAGHSMAVLSNAHNFSRLTALPEVTRPALRLLAVVAQSVASQQKVFKAVEVLRYGFGAAASVATGYEQHASSLASTERFRRLDATLAGVTDFIFGVGMPLTALADGVLNFATPRLAPSLKLSSGGFLSGNLQTAIHGLVALAEDVSTGDDAALQDFKRQAADGSLGVLFQGGAQACHAVKEAVSQVGFEGWLSER